MTRHANANADTDPDPDTTNDAPDPTNDALSTGSPAGADLPRDAGMSTAEYAIGTVAACGFAGVLWGVVHSATVAHLLQGVVERALSLAQ